MLRFPRNILLLCGLISERATHNYNGRSVEYNEQIHFTPILDDFTLLIVVGERFPNILNNRSAQ